MAMQERRCNRCGTAVAIGAARCPACGSDPTVGPLMIRRSQPPALPVDLRQLTAPVAAGATALVAVAGLRLLRRLLPNLRLVRPQPPVVTSPQKPARGRVIAVRQRIWAMGDSTGARRWGADETVWQVPGDDDG